MKVSVHAVEPTLQVVAFEDITIDPDQALTDTQVSYWEDAGLTALAEDAPYQRRLRIARRWCPEISRDDLALLLAHHYRGTPWSGLLTAPPEEVVDIIRQLRTHEVFRDDELEVIHNDVDYAIYCCLSGEHQTHWFLLAQWSTANNHITIEELRRRKRFSRVFVAAMGRMLRWQPNWNFRFQPDTRWRHGSMLLYGAFTAGFAAIGWIILLTTGLWWLALPVGLAGMILTAVHVSKHTLRAAAARYAVGWILTLNVAASVATGVFMFVHWNNSVHTQRVLVCGDFQQSGGSWAVHTSGGDLTLLPGFYDKIYEQSPGQTLARLMKGHWVNAKVHGKVGDGNQPFASGMATTGMGTCG